MMTANAGANLAGKEMYARQRQTVPALIKDNLLGS
jgi:hypothetical protein